MCWCFGRFLLQLLQLASGNRFASNSFILIEDSLLQQFSRFASNRRDNLEETALRLLSIRHANEVAIGTANNLNVSNHQRAIHDDDSVRLEITFVDRKDSDVCDFHSLTAGKPDARLAITSTKRGNLYRYWWEGVKASLTTEYGRSNSRFAEHCFLNLDTLAAKEFILAQVYVTGLDIVRFGPMRAPSMEVPFGINRILALPIDSQHVLELLV